MPSTDFFDDDLSNRDRGKAHAFSAGAGDVERKPADGPHRPVSDLNLTGMVRQKEEVEKQAAVAANELERLRQRQEELERERRELEELRRKQEEYERGRREIIERFNQSLISMEKEQLKSERLTELLQRTRTEFRGMLDEIRSIRDDEWESSQLREELGKALVIVDEARMAYNKAVARIETVVSDQQGSGTHAPLLPGEDEAAPRYGFGFWFKAGLAFGLPLIVTLILISAAYYVLRAMGRL